VNFQIDESKAVSLAKSVELVLLDVDGVLTDGKLYFSGAGEELKVFNTLDGHGIKLLLNNNIKVGIISGRDSAALDARAQQLGIEILFKGRENKLPVFFEIMASLENVTNEQVVYIGDDLPDIPVIKQAGLGIAVPNAHREVLRNADIITKATGGNGAVREVCDFLLESKGIYQQLINSLTGEI